MYELFMYVLDSVENINLSWGILIWSEHEIITDCKDSFFRDEDIISINYRKNC